MAAWRVGLLALVVGCAQVPPGLDEAGIAQAEALAGRVATEDILPTACALHGFECVVVREVVHGNIVHYSTTLQVGPGEHDVIGLHRVLRESAEDPDLTDPTVFLLHGAGSRLRHFNYRLAQPGVYLASRGFDVWGMDNRWVLVENQDDTVYPNLPEPPDHDFAFMASWGADTDVGDARTALAIARTARALSGYGADPMPFLGYSRGGVIGYALVDHEAQLAPSDRHVSAFIVGEAGFPPPPPGGNPDACEEYEALVATAHAQGWARTGGVTDGLVARYALDHPDEPSPFYPFLTNRDLFLVAMSAGFLEEGPPDHWHGLASADHEFVAPLQTWLPRGFAYADADQVLLNRVEHPQAPYVPLAGNIDALAVRCGDPSIVEAPWGQHLADVDLAVLYAGVQGGVGEDGLAALALLEQADVTAFVVDPDIDCPYAPLFTERSCSMGHIDPYYSEIAQGLYWRPVADWIAAHD